VNIAGVTHTQDISRVAGDTAAGWLQEWPLDRDWSLPPCQGYVAYMCNKTSASRDNNLMAATYHHYHDHKPVAREIPHSRNNNPMAAIYPFGSDIQCHAESLRGSAAQGLAHVQAAANLCTPWLAECS